MKMIQRLVFVLSRCDWIAAHKIFPAINNSTAFLSWGNYCHSTHLWSVTSRICSGRNYRVTEEKIHSHPCSLGTFLHTEMLVPKACSAWKINRGSIFGRSSRQKTDDQKVFLESFTTCRSVGWAPLEAVRLPRCQSDSLVQNRFQRTNIRAPCHLDCCNSVPINLHTHIKENRFRKQESKRKRNSLSHHSIDGFSFGFLHNQRK